MKLNKLTPEEERVILYKGTEAPFTGEYDTTFREGTYICRQCETPLYTSEANLIPVVDGPVLIRKFREQLSVLSTRTEVEWR